MDSGLAPQESLRAAGAQAASALQEQPPAADHGPSAARGMGAHAGPETLAFAKPRRRLRFKLRSAMRALLPMLLGVLFLALWQNQVFHRLLHLKLYQLPLPSTIWQTMRDNASLLADYTRYTLTEAIGGMLIGSAAGFAVALIATAWPRWGAGGLIAAAALNAVPIVALAPIANLWLGDGMPSRMLIVAFTTMAAMAINARKGMKMVDPLALDLMHACAASKIETFRYLRLPNSLPYVFAALKINATAGMIGAIVGEFFFSSRGLGYLLSNSIKVAKMPLGWSCIAVAAVGGILLYLIVELLEKVCLRWHHSARAD